MAAFEDDFTDVAGTLLSAHTPNVGTGWTLVGAEDVFKIGSTGTYLAAISGRSGKAHQSDDLGNADHITIFRVADSPNSVEFRKQFVCVRLTDHNNFIGWRWYGTGASGSRLTRIVSGAATDLISVSGAEATIRNGWVKIEAEGDTIRLFHGGTGATPSWTQVGSVTETFNNTVTRQGVAMNGTSNPTDMDFIRHYEADVFGGGGAVTVTRIVDVDALIQKQINITNTVDAQLSKTLFNTFAVNAVLLRSIAVLTEIDALLTVAQTAQTHVDSVLQMRREMTTDVNALLSKMQALVTDVDAVLIAAGITAITTEIDALLQKIRSVVATSDALLRKNLSSQVTIDSILQTRSTITTLINAIIQRPQSITLLADSVLFDANALGFQGTAGGFNLSQPSVNLGTARSVSFGASRSFILDTPRGFRRSS